MDSEILFWLFLAAVYILQALASKRKKTGPPAPGESPESSSEMPSELEEALGEIGRVLRGEPIGEQGGQTAESSGSVSDGGPRQRTSAAPTLPEPHYQVETERPAQRRAEPVIRSPRSSPSEPIDLGGRLTASPVFYDQAFEDQTTDTFNAPVITHDHVFGFKDPKKKEDTTPKVSRPDLRDHMVSRQSFIAAELLAPPLSKRGRKR